MPSWGQRESVTFCDVISGRRNSILHDTTFEAFRNTDGHNPRRYTPEAEDQAYLKASQFRLESANKKSIEEGLILQYWAACVNASGFP
jgi:hypothetical protein